MSESFNRFLLVNSEYAYLLAFLFMLTCVGLTIRRRNNIQKYRAQDAEIQRITEELNLLKLRADDNTLRYHLNPHFVFNSLNNLQYFINSGEKKIALSYVSRFSRFMRQIISLAGSPNTTLYYEAVILKQYLDLEKVRFEDKFEYSVNMPCNFEGADINIPSLMLYHLVENIIYIRVLNSLSPVFININFEYRSQYICFTIEDDVVLPAMQEKDNRQPDKLHEQIQRLNNTGKIQAIQTEIEGDDNTIRGGQVTEVRFYTKARLAKELAA